MTPSPDQDRPVAADSVTGPGRWSAWLNGLLGVMIFSGSLPATRIALRGFQPLFLTYSRATIAGAAAAMALLMFRQKWPERRDAGSLLLVAVGVVIGFPLLTALALQHITAARSILYIALLPVMTAVFAVLRAGERPRPPFWFFSIAASLLVMSFALTTGGIAGDYAGDLYMIAAIILCGLGYAEGGRLARRLGGWQVICWALVITLPIMTALTLVAWPQQTAAIDTASLIALGYVGLFSMLIGFIFWYRGLAHGGIASVGQLQFLQPFLGLALAALLLGDPVGWALPFVMMLAVACVAAAKRFA